MLKQKLVNWLLKGTHLDELHIGEHSVVISATGAAMGNTKVSGLAAPTVSGDALVKGTAITDAEHGVRTLANAHAHSALSGIGSSDHHVKTTSFADITDRAGLSKLNWTLNKLLKGAGAGADPTEIDVTLAQLTVNEFRFNPATPYNASTNPQAINDGDTATYMTVNGGGVGTARGAVVGFPAAARITEWRQFGHTDNAGGMNITIEYMDILGNWVNWVTGITTRNTADWSLWDSSGGEVIAVAIRIVGQIAIAGAGWKLPELEVRGVDVPISRLGITRLNWTANKLLKGAGAGVDPAEIDPVSIASGSYTGDSTANRAIPHGLGVIPKVVLLFTQNSYLQRIQAGKADIWFVSSAASGYWPVTAMDATNFYVGNTNEFSQSANINGGTSWWVAIG